MLQTAPRKITTTESRRVRAISSENKWIAPVLIAVAGLLTFLPSLGLTGIIDPSDGFFSESSREMFESGNFIVPRLNYEPYNNKPILTNWLICGSYKLFGVNEYASRLPSALCAIALCVAVYLFARRFLSRRVAATASLILLSSILFSTLGRVSLTDMPLAFLINVSLFALFTGLEMQSKRLILLGHIALGLSFLTKGPIALLMAGGTFFLYALARARNLAPKTVAANFSTFAKLMPVRTLLIVAAINLPWFIAVAIATNGSFINDFFFTENIMRAMGKIQANHAQAPYYYFEIFGAGFFPWTLMLFAGIPSLGKWWKRRVQATQRLRFLTFCTAFAVTIFCGFSLLKGKLPTYILPMFPAASILVAAAIDALARIRTRRALMWTVPIMLVATIGAVAGVLIKVKIAAPIQFCIEAIGCATIFSVLAYALWLFQRRGSQAIWQFTISWTLIAAVFVPFLFKIFYNHHQRPYSDLLEEARSMKLPVMEIVNESPSAPFYLHKHVPSIQNFFDLAYVLASAPGEKLIICPDKFEELPQRVPRHRLIDRRQQYCLYAVEDPKNELLTGYLAKVRQAEIDHKRDPNVPGRDRIVTRPSKGMFLQ